MSERYYLVELRCGSCGLIFIGSGQPMASYKVEEYKNMFKAKGPERFVQCKNRCQRWPVLEGRPVESPYRQPVNTNQTVVVTEIPAAELRSRGLMN
jgi:hypothetical protein